MPFVSAGGVSINFPFEPYACQLTYMEKVVTCLKNAQNGILESPTGTGKTLCLLCGSLAWLEDKKAQISSQRWRLAQSEPGNALGEIKEALSDQLDTAAGQWAGELAAPKLIYASRTHTQLTQAIQELKRTAYRHFRVCVLGSREQLCIHPHVIKEESNTAKVHLCRAKVASRSCHFHNNLDNQKHQFSNQVMDIEDLVRAGEKHSCCPYYAARELKAEADIIFMPYNYLLDPKSRRAHGVELQGNIIIFDEAHNLERICEESTSFELSSVDIAAAMRELNDLSEKLVDMVRNEESGADMGGESQAVVAEDFNLKDVLELKAMLTKLESELEGINLQGKEGITKPGRFMFELLERVNLSFDTKTQAQNVLEKIVSYLTNEGSSSVFHSKGAGLTKFADAIKIVFSREPLEFGSISSHQESLSQHYKVHIREEKQNPNKKKKGTWDTAAQSNKSVRVLSYWCFSPGHAMEDLRAQGVRCIILTSGTLSPMESFKLEMGIDFNVELENPHVIEKHQVWVGTVGKGPDGTMLNSSYQHRFKVEYQASLGNAIVNFARVVPHGLLLFFPSYPVMSKCIENWQCSNIWSRIEQYKPVFVEPRNKHEFSTAMVNFYSKINDPTLNGAIFAAVCRGKVSEGLDFSDTNGRAVVITGLPFPPRMDPRVVLKMEYLNDMLRIEKKGLSGEQWYRQQASRAVNQAVGRVIRHRQDYGAIILCDTRFSSPQSQSQLPGWLRPQHQTCANFGLALRDVMMFFKHAEKTMPQPQGHKAKVRINAGCEGAHFEPAGRRTATISTVAQPASSVATHVPSLKRKKDESPSLAQLQIQYEGSSSHVQKPASRGLLSALDSAEGTRASQLGSLESSNRASTSSVDRLTQPPFGQPNKKRKILIKSRQPASADVTKDSLQSAELYLAEVKRTLSSENYSYFARTLAQYKKTAEFVPMITCLADIFTQDTQKHHLFRRFYRFVRSKHKEQFEQTCQEIIGQSCGHEAQAMLKKRQREGDSVQGPGDKKRITEAAQNKNIKSSSMDTKTESVRVLPSSSSLDAQTHLNHGGANMGQKHATSSCTLDASTHLNKGVEMSVNKADQTKCNTLLQDRVNLPADGTISKFFSSTKAGPSEKQSADISSQATSSSTGSGSQDLFDSPTDKPTQPLEELQNPPEQLPNPPEPARSGYPCCVCSKSALVPLKAPCDHIACMDCWKGAIRDHKQCPACGARVKRKHLARLFFSASVEAQ